MSAGLAVKHNPPHSIGRAVHDEEEEASSSKVSEEKKGSFLFGQSMTREDEEELELSECTSVESLLTPEMGEQLKKIHEEVDFLEEQIIVDWKLAQKFEEEFRRRLSEEQKESDKRWIAHEKEQIRHLQDSHESMLKFLHKEVERIQGICKDAKKPVIVIQEAEDVKELKNKLKLYEEAIKQLEEQLKIKDEQTTDIEAKVKLTMERLKEQNDIQAERIRQLSSELNDRNQTVAHLSAQLRNYRLRDAMATAQQRRKASQGSPVLSPTSPNKAFPSKGVVSSSVSITYPGSKSMSISSPGELFDGPGSIERPSRRRASSGFGK